MKDQTATVETARVAYQEALNNTDSVASRISGGTAGQAAESYVELGKLIIERERAIREASPNVTDEGEIQKLLNADSEYNDMLKLKAERYNELIDLSKEFSDSVYEVQGAESAWLTAQSDLEDLSKEIPKLTKKNDTTWKNQAKNVEVVGITADEAAEKLRNLYNVSGEQETGAKVGTDFITADNMANELGSLQDLSAKRGLDFMDVLSQVMATSMSDEAINNLIGNESLLQMLFPDQDIDMITQKLQFLGTMAKDQYGLAEASVVTETDRLAESFGNLSTQNQGFLDKIGTNAEEVSVAFSSLTDIDLMKTISTSNEEFKRFSDMVVRLSKFPGIDIEVMMQTETGEDPKAVAKNIENTIKQIGNIDFKKSFGDNWEEMAAASTALNPQEFINMARKIQSSMGKAFDPKEIADWYKNALTSVDSLRDNFAKSFDKDSGILKKVTVPIIASVFGENIENQEGIMKAINAALPDGFNPMILPIIAQLMMDPALKELLKNPGNIASVSKYISSGGTVDEGLRIDGSETGSADRMESRTITVAGSLGSLPNLTGSPFAGQTGSDKSGSGSGQKSIIQQLKDQFKSLQDVYEGYAKNISKKTGMFKGIAAGPFGKQFIDYLTSQGDEGIKILKEKGKKFNQAYEEFVKVQNQLVKNYLNELPEAFNQQRNEIKGRDTLTKDLQGMGFSTGNTESVIEGLGSDTVSEIGRISGKNKKTKEEKAFLAQFKIDPKTGKIPPALEKALVSSQKTDKVSRDSFVTAKEDAFKLEQDLSGALGKNIDPEVIDMLIEMGFTAEDAANNVNEISKYAEKLNNVLVKTSFTDEMKDLTKETDNANRALELMGQGIPADIANQIANMGNSANFSADQISELVATMQQLEILKLALQDPAELRLQQMMGQERINQLNYEIDLIESVNADEKMAAAYTKENVTNHEDLLAVYERQNEAKSRAIELRQRDLEPLDEQIEKLEEQKTKI
jgi:hypothetical protein